MSRCCVLSSLSRVYLFLSSFVYIFFLSMYIFFVSACFSVSLFIRQFCIFSISPLVNLSVYFFILLFFFSFFFACSYLSFHPSIHSFLRLSMCLSIYRYRGRPSVPRCAVCLCECVCGCLCPTRRCVVNSLSPARVVEKSWLYSCVGLNASTPYAKTTTNDDDNNDNNKNDDGF